MGAGSCVLTFATLLSERLQLVHKLVDVLKFPIDGCKADIGDLVQLMQLLHDFFTDDPTFNLRLAHLLDPLFDPVGDGFDRADTDRSLFTGFFQADENLIAVKRLAATVLLHDNGKNFLDSLVSGIAAFTTKALPAATNDFAFLGHTRIDDLVFKFIAEGTFHRRRPALSLSTD